MADKAAVVARPQENPDYVAAFKASYGADIFADPEAACAAMAKSIASFDSKYDRFLRGEAKLSDKEELGRLLFFSKQFTNCNLCHQLRSSQTARDKTFSNHQYHNIGVPVNAQARKLNGTKPGHVDHGLLENPAANDPAQDGKFKVPTLRNVAVTGPYMHNGVFKDLRTTILFYNKYNSKSEARQINPETGKRGLPPEVPATLSTKELTHGPNLDDARIDALVAFLKMLTDRCYEALMKE